jgi:hypothetical protein
MHRRRQYLFAEIVVFSDIDIYASNSGDGNCLFRSIADQLHGDCSLHSDIRANVVRHIIANKDVFETSIEDDELFDDYVDRMRSISCRPFWDG